MAGETEKGTSNTMGRNAGLRQFPGSAEENQILEGKAIAVARSALGAQEPGTSLGAYLRLGQAE